MKNSELLQYIIEVLKDSPVKWQGNLELFELLCNPIPYGNEAENKRINAIKSIWGVFINSDQISTISTIRSKFNRLANNIICGDKEHQRREEIWNLIKDLKTDVDIKKLIRKIPCKDNLENNYRSRFGNWKTNKMEIRDEDIKEVLEKNFDFHRTLWEKGDFMIKSTLKAGIEKFIRGHTRKDKNIFDEIRKDFKLQSIISNNEIDDLQDIRGMDEREIMSYIEKHYPLDQNRSQGFLIKFASILDAKGYYQLLLDQIIDLLEVQFKEKVKIKKIKAHALGSTAVGKYKEAFDLLSTIKFSDDEEVIDLQTQAISNMRRYQLTNVNIDMEQKKDIILKILGYYEKVFYHNKHYNYYPGVNLAYMTVITQILFQDKIKFTQSISEIYKKSEKSIKNDKKSKDINNQYYAQMAIIEFLLLKDNSNALPELERFLEVNSEIVTIIELERTQRQMWFFMDTVESYFQNDSVVEKIKKAIRIIDDFIDVWEMR